MTSTASQSGADSPSRFTGTTGAVLRAGVLAAAAAAAATVVFALVAKAIDIPLEVDGEEIPTPGFAFVTLMWSVVGIGIALAFARWAKRPARTFVATTVALTVLSFAPVVTADATTATQVALVVSHMLAAAIVIPTVARQLPRSR